MPDEHDMRFNLRATTAILVLLALLLGGFGGYTWWRLSNELRAENLVETAERGVEKNFPELRSELKKAIVKNAAMIVEKMSDRGLESVPDARKRLASYLERKMDVAMAKATALSEKEFREFLRANSDLIKQAYKDLLEAPKETREAVVRLEKSIEKAADINVKDDSRLALDFMYLLLEKLNTLGQDPKELSRGQQVERRIAGTLRAMQSR